jgi:DNA-binding NarL/FixJ family response regulator
MNAITSRECQIIAMIARGLRNGQIADELHRSILTVRKHRQNLMRKLGLRSALEVAAYAIRNGLASRSSGFDIAPAPVHVTRCESEIMGMIADGLSNRQMADELNRSILTVRKHRQNLMGKLGVRNAVDVASYAGRVTQEYSASIG